jgi:hypothetical protein
MPLNELLRHNRVTPRRPGGWAAGTRRSED